MVNRLTGSASTNATASTDSISDPMGIPPIGHCDLHMHSTASDGTDLPHDLAARCAEAGVSTFALTDHDTTAGLVDAGRAAAQLGLRFVPGIELSADPSSLPIGQPIGTLHILGYGIQHDNPKLKAIEERLLEARAERNPQMIANLQTLGIDIEYDEVIEVAGGAVIGRPHIAEVIVRKGHAVDIKDAFRKYIGAKGAAYTRKDRLSAADAIAAIHDAGGLAVLAHPVQLKLDDQTLPTFVQQLKDNGLNGIEIHHSDHSADHVARYRALSQQFDLIPTGGSDYHGSRKTIGINDCKVPIGLADQLLEQLELK